MTPTINSAPAQVKEITIGKKINLVCYYKNALNGGKCVFIVYKPNDIGRKEKKYEGFIIQPGMFVSKDFFEPKFSWFEKGEKKIEYIFDLEYKGQRITCKDQRLIIIKELFLPKYIYHYDKGKQSGSTRSNELTANEIRKYPTNSLIGWKFNSEFIDLTIPVLGSRDIEDLSVEECRNAFRTLMRLGSHIGSVSGGFIDYRELGEEIIKEFIYGHRSGGGIKTFEHEKINRQFAIRIRDFTNDYVINPLHKELRKYNGDISKVILKKGKNIEGLLIKKPSPKELFGPALPDSLMLFIHDILSLTMNFIDYDVYGGIAGGFWYSCKLEIVFTDDFSLDYGDPISGKPTKYLEGFKYWFVLQHFENFGSRGGKPFDIRGVFEIEFEGNLLSSYPPEVQHYEMVLAT